MTDFEDGEQMCNRKRAFATLFLNTFNGFPFFFFSFTSVVGCLLESHASIFPTSDRKSIHAVLAMSHQSAAFELS